MWNENTKNAFAEGLTSILMKQKIRILEENNDISPVALVAEIKSILLSNAVDCKLKTFKKSNKESRNLAPWFDKECKSKKFHQGKILKKNPGNPEARLELSQQKKHLKRLIAMKKRSHKQNMLHKMTNMRSETKPKAFWNMLKKISPKVKVDSKNIPAHNFSQYFKKLLNTRRTLDIPPAEEKVGELDYSISLDELKKASSILKPGKALGIDNIGN